MKSIKLFLILIILFLSSIATAQGMSDVEFLYDNFDKQEEKRKSKTKKKKRRRKKESDISKLSDLVSLAPFKDVAVIQKRFLPKSNRFEFNGSLALSLNNPFFNNLGGSFRFGYYFTSKLGLELVYFQLDSNEKDATRGLKDRAVKTTSLVTPSSFYGLALKWSPIYGKMSLVNLAVVPFDIYFQIGGGVTDTGKDQSPTVYLGTGQIFALSKSAAFRWDFTLNSYAPKVESTSSSTGYVTQSQFDLFISAGVSFFFPGAKYR